MIWSWCLVTERPSSCCANVLWQQNKHSSNLLKQWFSTTVHFRASANFHRGLEMTSYIIGQNKVFLILITFFIFEEPGLSQAWKTFIYPYFKSVKKKSQDNFMPRGIFYNEYKCLLTVKHPFSHHPYCCYVYIPCTTRLHIPLVHITIY